MARVEEQLSHQVRELLKECKVPGDAQHPSSRLFVTQSSVACVVVWDLKLQEAEECWDAVALDDVNGDEALVSGVLMSTKGVSRIQWLIRRRKEMLQTAEGGGKSELMYRLLAFMAVLVVLNAFQVSQQTTS